MREDPSDVPLADSVLVAFTASATPSAPRTATEVATELDEPVPATATALAELVDRGELASRVPTGGERVWWRPPSGRVGDGRGSGDVAGSTAGRDVETTRPSPVDGVFRRLVRRVLGTRNRESLERAVCEELVGVDRYRFVACGENAGTDGGLTVRASAGISATDVEAGLERAGRSSPAEVGRRVAWTGDLRLVQRLEDAPAGPWDEIASRGGAGSYAVVPLVHDGVVEGTLCVGADRPDAFDEADRGLLADLGVVVGCAIAALTRGGVREVATEMAFVSDGLGDAFAEPEGIDGTSGHGRIEIDVDSIVPLDDGTQLQYWDVTGASAATAVEALTTMGTTLDTRLVSTVAGVHRIELHTATESVFTVLDEFDGRLVSASVDDGTFRATARVGTGVDPAAVTAAVRELYPSVRLASCRKVVSDAYLRRIVEESLTERQATVLRVAYAGGYFRQPRDSTGGELADRLGITRQTFNQHLRKAEARVLEAVFDPDDEQ